MHNEVEIDNIENRPKELYALDYYSSLPNSKFEIDLEGSIGDFLKMDILDLDGIQPVEDFHVNDEGLITVNPSDKLVAKIKTKKTKFQLIHLVVNTYAFTTKDGKTYAKPYAISLMPSSKRCELTEVDIESIQALNLESINEQHKVYYGFNPFKGAYGFFGIGEMPYPEIETDMYGFVISTYALSTNFDHQKVLCPHIPLIKNHNQARKDYFKYRKDWYFKKFSKIKPRKIWGCDSPIELFLLQAMNSIGLAPDIQTFICHDGFTAPSFHKLWENQRSRKRMKAITEADFYFPDKKVAIFCDSRQHHSQSDKIEKDKKIDTALTQVGIKSYRIFGPDIAKSPIECANSIKEFLESL